MSDDGIFSHDSSVSTNHNLKFNSLGGTMKNSSSIDNMLPAIDERREGIHPSVNLIIL